MITDAQLDANRANALLSTGPRTEAGKAVSMLNAVKHGFAGRTILLSIEEAGPYKAHFASYEAQYKPRNPTEHFLVTSLAELSWSAQKLRGHMENLLTQRSLTHEPAQDFSDETTNAQVAQAGFLIDHAKELGLLGLYEQRKMRIFRETVKDLARMQAERREEERQDMTRAAAYRKVLLAKYKPGTPAWEPAEDGFVYSLAEIDQYIVREERKIDVLQFIQAANKAK